MITEKNITDLRNWLEFIHMDFNNDKLDSKHRKALGQMINILYGRKAKPNQVNRKKNGRRTIRTS